MIAESAELLAWASDLALRAGLDRFERFQSSTGEVLYRWVVYATPTDFDMTVRVSDLTPSVRVKIESALCG